MKRKQKRKEQNNTLKNWHNNNKNSKIINLFYYNQMPAKNKHYERTLARIKHHCSRSWSPSKKKKKKE